ncbi:unnamed protein product [Lathyrus sativus]|nr:unnamed protein product [Lathyrus sativus]
MDSEKASLVDVTENNKVVYVRSLLITLDVDYTDEWLVLWLFWGIISSWIRTLLFKSDCTACLLLLTG